MKIDRYEGEDGTGFRAGDMIAYMGACRAIYRRKARVKRIDVIHGDMIATVELVADGRELCVMCRECKQVIGGDR